MKRGTSKALIAVCVVAVILLGLWYFIWVAPDVPTKSVRNFFLDIMNERYESAWHYIYPKSEFARLKGGPTLDMNVFISDLEKARAQGTRITKVEVLDYFWENDPFERTEVPVVQIRTENLVSGNPKVSDPKNYYLKKDPFDKTWKIYKGVVPKD
jgi:hypothetical protein